MIHAMATIPSGGFNVFTVPLGPGLRANHGRMGMFWHEWSTGVVAEAPKPPLHLSRV